MTRSDGPDAHVETGGGPWTFPVVASAGDELAVGARVVYVIRARSRDNEHKQVRLPGTYDGRTPRGMCRVKLDTGRTVAVSRLALTEADR